VACGPASHAPRIRLGQASNQMPPKGGYGSGISTIAGIRRSFWMSVPSGRIRR
jgi:hypothetical protein